MPETITPAQPKANIIPLPTAAPAPVVQSPRRGRLPKSIAIFREAWTQRARRRDSALKLQRERELVIGGLRFSQERLREIDRELHLQERLTS